MCLRASVRARAELVLLSPPPSSWQRQEEWGVGALYIIIEVLLGYVSDLLFHLAHEFCAVIEDILQVLQHGSSKTRPLLPVKIAK